MLRIPRNIWSALAGRERDSRMPCASTMRSIDRPRRGDATRSPVVRVPFLILATLAALVGCASAGSGSRSHLLRVSTPSTVLTEAEITRAGARTAYETIERLRPWYLSLTRTRGASGGRAVYVDGMRLGGLDALHGIPSASVREIRTLDAREATTRFGTGPSAGAIVVVTRVGR